MNSAILRQKCFGWVILYKKDKETKDLKKIYFGKLGKKPTFARLLKNIQKIANTPGFFYV